MSGGMHRLVCPVRSRWRLRRYGQPFWNEDRIAQTLGVAAYGCPRCGRGATKARDAEATS